VIGGGSGMDSAWREQRIRERAYAIWESEGRPAGRAEAHWLQAEAEIADEARQSEQGAARASKRLAARAKKQGSAGPAGAPAHSGRRRA
jgi:hypothetical protein